MYAAYDLRVTFFYVEPFYAMRFLSYHAASGGKNLIAWIGLNITFVA